MCAEPLKLIVRPLIAGAWSVRAPSAALARNQGGRSNVERKGGEGRHFLDPLIDAPIRFRLFSQRFLKLAGSDALRL